MKRFFMEKDYMNIFLINLHLRKILVTILIVIITI